MTVRLGIIAASRIAEEAVVGAPTEGVDLVAVAARSPERAERAAARWGIPASFGSYEAMLGSDDVDAVYIGAPAALHRRWAVAALEAGKHVLVEKPVAANAADGSLIAEAAARSDRVVMVGYHWRYHPLVKQMREILDGGVLGDLRRIEASFEVAASHIARSDIRWDIALGGGAMMDIGCYPAEWARFAANAEPTVVSAEAVCPVDGIDGSLEADLAWPSGCVGRIRGSMIATESDTAGGFTGHRATLRVEGTEGAMVVDNPLAPQHGSTLRIETPDATVEHDVDTSTTYSHQMVAFRDAVEHGEPFPTTVADALATQRIIDACYQAAGLLPRPTHD